jgi:hypothetical protein
VVVVVVVVDDVVVVVVVVVDDVVVVVVVVVDVVDVVVDVDVDGNVVVVVVVVDVVVVVVVVVPSPNALMGLTRYRLIFPGFVLLLKVPLEKFCTHTHGLACTSSEDVQYRSVGALVVASSKTRLSRTNASSL